MTGDDIRRALKKKGLTFTIVAEAMDPPVAPGTVSAVAHRKATSRRVASALAKSLGKSVASVFPDVDAYRKVSRDSKVAALKEVIAA
ncbi:MAG: hypothetical protein SV201_04905 [Pseudomonadota bacterium]|nr:hypothetical protein [Pseudomonadota bacterium]